MNRDDLEKILPSKMDEKWCESKAVNSMRQDCIDALLKSGVGLVPSIAKINQVLVDIPLMERTSARIAADVRALMLPKEK